MHADTTPDLAPPGFACNCRAPRRPWEGRRWGQAGTLLHGLLRMSLQ